MINLEPFKKGFHLEDLFKDDFFTPRSNNHLLRSDISETEMEYMIEMDIPGVRKEDIDIDYVNHHLIVSGNRIYEHNVNEENYIQRERMHGQFKRSFYVDNIDEGQIHASFHDGVLIIRLPKLEHHSPRKRKIDIY